MRDLSAGHLNKGLEGTVEPELAGHPVVVGLAEAAAALRSVEPPGPTPALNEFLRDDRDGGCDDDE